ncbi:hypothetical protein RDWZM_009724 [Blomia tropicalis]|uniref:TAFII55 protein conserved region domain-containing protein n=1 Tax=Blomia tropicalis TaxID=40697 RepID=A0A9Q0M6U2_BLOTA|nr:transcription initiation factor TFIID subunit 7 [Blomia tropicalis]KAJ6218567.1 hypothetical protein RDWZM_009724 [Blomia tropicalis]
MPPDEFRLQNEANENPEQEAQFILRLPSLPAASLRAAVKSGVLNLKDRLSVQIEQDMRNGTVRFDGWVLPAKIVDLPTIIESHKTLDNKNFYKTADICQMMICKEETDEVKDEPEAEVKKSKDGKDKKYLYPHGITKPLKNVRKKRFRKTLRKKYVDFPEIEKEVKRLLRSDNEAKHVRYEIVNIEDEAKGDGQIKDNPSTSGVNSAYDVGDLFGDVVSSSDEDFDDNEENSMSELKDFLKDDTDNKMPSELSFAEMLQQSTSNANIAANSESANDSESFRISIEDSEGKEAASCLEQGIENENETLRAKLAELDVEIHAIHTQRMAQQVELDGIENMALKQRFQSIIDDLNRQEEMKKHEFEELKRILNM